MAYDPENKILVAVDGKKGKHTYHYDLAANTWTKVVDKPEDSTEVPNGHDARTPIGYDPAGKVCLLYDPKTPDSMWSYDVKEKKWTKHEVKGPAGPTRKLIGYFDPARGVMVVNFRETTWVYRHTKKE